MPTGRQYDQWRDLMPPPGWGRPLNWMADSSLHFLSRLHPAAIDWDPATIMMLPKQAWSTFYNCWGGNAWGLLQQLGFIGGNRYILKVPDGTNAGIAYIDGELLSIDRTPAMSSSIRYIIVRTTKEDIHVLLYRKY